MEISLRKIHEEVSGRSGEDSKGERSFRAEGLAAFGFDESNDAS